MLDDLNVRWWLLSHETTHGQEPNEREGDCSGDRCATSGLVPEVSAVAHVLDAADLSDRSWAGEKVAMK